jgi:hypothetical protein
VKFYAFMAGEQLKCLRQDNPSRVGRGVYLAPFRSHARFFALGDEDHGGNGSIQR